MCKIADWVIFVMLGMCGVCDWKKKQIPLLLLIGMSVVVVGAVVLSGKENLQARACGVAIGILFFIISKCTHQSVGYGDSWLILLLGGYLGIFEALQVLFIASLAAGVASLFFLWKKRWKKSATLPFVPFLTISYLGVLFA